MHPVIGLIAVIVVTATATSLSAYKMWNRKQKTKNKINKLIKRLACDTANLRSFNFEKLQKQSSEIVNFFKSNSINDSHNYINNLFNTCQYLILDRQINFFMDPEDLNKKFKKEFDYIRKTVNKL